MIETTPSLSDQVAIEAPDLYAIHDGHADHGSMEPAQYRHYEPVPPEWPEGHGRSILQIVPKLRSGGVERGTLEIGEALALHGFRSYVISEGGGLVSRLERQGSKHIAMPVASKNPLVIWQNISRMVDIIRRGNIDLIHARSRAPAWSAYYAAKATGIPFITTFHGHYRTQNGLKRRYNSVMTEGDRVIAISDFTARHIMEQYHPDRSKLRIIPRGVDLQSFSAEAVTRSRMIALAEQWRLPDDRPIILMPGRFTRWKGHEWLIKALALMQAMEFCCVMVGDDDGHGDYRRSLEQMVIKLGLGGMVRMVEPTQDMPSAYMLADVVVCPSLEPEAFGRVPVEASAMGKPVVAAGHGGALETIISGLTGWHVQPGDAEALATALVAVLRMPTRERALFGAKGRAHIERHFSLAHMQARTLAVYDQLLKDRRR